MASLSAPQMYGTKGVGGCTSAQKSPAAARADSSTAAARARYAFRHADVTGIAASARPPELCSREMASGVSACELRDYLNDKLHKNLDEIYITGSVDNRLPTTEHQLRLRRG